MNLLLGLTLSGSGVGGSRADSGAKRILASAGHVSISGQDAGLVAVPSIAASGGSVALVGSDAEVGSAVPVDPGTVADLELWLDASVGITLNGSDVSAWADQSGNGNDATQGTASAQPAFNSTGLNGFPTVEFDGVDEFLICDGVVPAFVGEDLPHTMFFVTYRGASPTNGGVVAIETATPSSTLNQTKWASSTSASFFMQIGDAAGVASSTSSVDSSPTTPDIFAHSYSGTSGRWFRQTSAFGGPNTVNRGVSTPTRGRIGAVKPGLTGNAWYLGGISEIILYTRELDQAEREGIVAYLKDKYGL